MMRDLFRRSKKPISLLASLILLLSTLTPNLTDKVKSVLESGLGSDKVESSEIPTRENDDALQPVYVDGKLLCCGNTEDYSVSSLKSIIIDDNEYELKNLPSDELFQESTKYKYYFEASDVLLDHLKSESCAISVKDDNDFIYSIKDNSSAFLQDGLTVTDLTLSEGIEVPCLYLGSYTNQLSFVSGYWSNDDEINVIGSYHNVAAQISNTVGSDLQLPTPASSVQFNGKVYDYYNDAELQGASLVDSDTFDNYYYKFNEALSNYYKVNNYDYYKVYNDSYHDTFTDNSSYYSQTYGIQYPIYLGLMENDSSSPYYNNDTSYGLFGIDNGYCLIDGMKVTSINKVKSTAISSLLPSGNVISNDVYAAVQGIVENKLGDDGEVLMKTNRPDGQGISPVVLPLFDESFLDGNNCLNAQIGETSDAVFMFDRTTKKQDGKETVWYTLAQDTRFFYNADGSRDAILYKSKTNSELSKKLMPLNYINQEIEYRNSGYSVRFDVPFTAPESKNNYTVNVSGNNSTFVYLDGNLILDMGGVNSIENNDGGNIGTIDFLARKATVKNVKSLNSVICNIETDFNIEPGTQHTLTFIHINHNTSDGCFNVETNLPLKSDLPTAMSSYEVKTKFSASKMTDKLSSFVDSLNFKNRIEVDAAHSSGEMLILPEEETSLFGGYSGGYRDRIFYEQNQNWKYDYSSNEIDKTKHTVDLGNEQTYASLGLVYQDAGSSADMESQKADMRKILLDNDGNIKDLTKLFDVSVTNYHENLNGVYDGSNFLIGSVSDEEKGLSVYDGDRIPSISDPGASFENYAWTNKTIIDNEMKDGRVTVEKNIIGNEYGFLMSNTKSTYKVYYLNVENVFGVLPKEYSTYNGEKCILDTLTLDAGEKFTFSVPIGIRCVIVEENSNDYSNVTKVKNNNSGKTLNYFDFVVSENNSYECVFVDEYKGQLKESVSLSVNIDWIDGSNNLKTRPDISLLKPSDLFSIEEQAREKSLTNIVFMGEDGKWHYLSDLFDVSNDVQLYNQFTHLLKYSVTKGDSNKLIISGLPKYALSFMCDRVGSTVLKENTEMKYGLLQKQYGEYTLSPRSSQFDGAVQTTGETITNTIDGSLTINTFVGDGTTKTETLDGVEFALYSSEFDAANGEHSVAIRVTKDGQATFESLSVGTYWLVQTNSLSSYEFKNVPVEIKISYDTKEDLNMILDIFNDRTVRDIMVTNEVDVRQGVVPENGYKERDFDFNVILNDVNSKQEYVVEITDERTDTVTQKKYIAGSDGSLSVDFKLKDDQSVTLKDIPNGASYVITEKASENYIHSYTVSHNAEALIEKTQDAKTNLNEPISTAVEVVDLTETYDDKDVNFVFRNLYSETHYTLPDSGSSKMLTMIIIALCGFILFGSMYIVVEMRKSYELTSRHLDHS